MAFARVQLSSKPLGLTVPGIPWPSQPNPLRSFDRHAFHDARFLSQNPLPDLDNPPVEPELISDHDSVILVLDLPEEHPLASLATLGWPVVLQFDPRCLACLWCFDCHGYSESNDDTCDDCDLFHIITSSHLTKPVQQVQATRYPHRCRRRAADEADEKHSHVWLAHACFTGCVPRITHIDRRCIAHNTRQG